MHRGTKRGRRETKYDHAHFAPLVRATNHVAPYYSARDFHTYGRYTDALKVIRAYNRGALMTLDRDTLVRLARDLYRRNTGFRAFGREHR